MLDYGTETGSVINGIYSRMTKDAPVPTVGMGATILQWSDRTAGTIISIEGKIIRVQEDFVKRTDTNGVSESQEYEYSSDTSGYIRNFRLEKNGSYSSVYMNKETGRWNKRDSHGLIIGMRRQYYDFSF